MHISHAVTHNKAGRISAARACLDATSREEPNALTSGTSLWHNSELKGSPEFLRENVELGGACRQQGVAVHDGQ